MTNDHVIADMLRLVASLPAQVRSLRRSEGCVLAADLYSPVDIPSAPTATRDGYAVRSEDVRGALTLGIRPGLPACPAAATVPALAARTACRVLTGGLLPVGADAVVTQEQVQLVSRPAGNSIEISGGVRAGQHVVAKGAELSRGATAIAAGTWLGPHELALAAAIGFQQVPIIPRPRVGVIVTGSELYQSCAAASGLLHASNAVLVEAMVRACGGTVGLSEVVSDDQEALADAFGRALDCDVILSTGGTGRGSADLIRGVLQKSERSSMWGVPSGGSKPMSFRVLGAGQDREVPHLALPGRPVAAALAFALFGFPLLRRLAGYADLLPKYTLARFEDAGSTTERFIPVRLERHQDGVRAEARSSSSLYGLTSAIDADGFALMPRPGEATPGDLVRVLLMPWSQREGRFTGNELEDAIPC